MTTKVDLWSPYTEANTYMYLHTHKYMQLHKKEKRNIGKEESKKKLNSLFFRQSTSETQQSIHEGNDLVTFYQVPPYSSVSLGIVCNV